MSVVVVGSANLDRVFRVERIPGPGETVLARSSTDHCGGKGNNQVVATARAGASAQFVCALGADDAARQLLTSLQEAGVEVVAHEVSAPTGLAHITVGDDAENSIVVSAGANGLLQLDDTDLAAIRAAHFLLMQLEVPLDTVELAAAEATAAGTLVVLNAAPVAPLRRELLALVDVLIVNEHEASQLAAGPGEDATGFSAEQAGRRLLETVPAVIVTLGSAGALVCVPGPDPESDSDVRTELVPAHRVRAVDSTGAGDTFCGALVAALDRANGTSSADAAGSGIERDPSTLASRPLGLDELVEATRFATAAAALSVQRPGAVSSIPQIEEIIDALSH